MPSPPDVSVLIVNYNGGAFVQGALDSLKRQTYRDFEVILVDNASTDGSADSLDTAGLPAFTLMKETENHGFARGNNLAAAEAKGLWLALLNPDAAAQPNWLEEVSNGIKRWDGVETFACKQVWMQDAGILDGVGDNYLIFGIPWRGGYRQPVEATPEEGNCFSACGASAIYRRATFWAVGGFDEQLFCYCEDVDLGFRFQLEGLKCVFLPTAVVAHQGSGISSQQSGFAVKYGTRNRLWVYLKCMPLPLLFLTLPGHVALTLAILARGMMTGKFRPAFAGLVEGIVGIRSVWQQRQLVQVFRNTSLWALARSMVWNPLKMLNRQSAVTSQLAPSEKIARTPKKRAG